MAVWPRMSLHLMGLQLGPFREALLDWASVSDELQPRQLSVSTVYKVVKPLNDRGPTGLINIVGGDL